MPFNLDNSDLHKLNISNLAELSKKLELDVSLAVRTRRRGLLLIAISVMQPVTRLGLEKLGFTKRVISSFAKDAKNDDLIKEKAFLISITNAGKEVLDELTKDSYLATFYNRIAHKDIQKARISKLKKVVAGS